jgi:hypothetical protein
MNGGDPRKRRVKKLLPTCLVPLTAIKDRKSYAAANRGASSIWHLAMTFATDFEVHLNG